MQSATVTVSSVIVQVGVQISDSITDPLTNYAPAYNNAAKITYGPGTGVLKINKAFQRLCVIPAGGADTFNFNTGAVTGSETDTLSNPIGSSNSFTTTGLNLLDIDMAAGGSQTIKMYPGSSNGFTGFGSGTIPLRGSDSTSAGGSHRFSCTDSVGYTVSASNCNLVILNADTVNASTFTLSGGGQ